MKKLMIAAVAAVFGIAANAASVQWNVSNNGATDKGGTTLASGSTIYFVLASQESTVVDALKAGTLSDSTTGVLGTQTTTNTRGKTGTATVTGKGLTLTPEGKGVSTDFKILVVDTTTVSGETWYKLSGVLSANTYDESAEVPVPTTATFTSTQWAGGTAWTQAQAAPEPTSAMLMLLGFAGLALRRRRA